MGRSVLQWDFVAIFSEEKYKAVAGYSARQWLQKRRHSRWNVFTYGSVKVCSGREKWPLRGVGKARDPGGGLVRYLQLHLHQEDSVMVGEDLVYSLIVTLL